MRTYEATIILLSISRGKNGVLRNAFSYAETLTVVHDLCGKSPENVYGVMIITAKNDGGIYGAIVRKGVSEHYMMGTVMR